MKRIFIGPHGLRAGWRFAAFWAIWFVIAVTGAKVLQKPLYRFFPGIQFGPVNQAIHLSYVLAATWIMSRVDSRPFSSFGLGGAGRLRNFAAGAGAGFAAISVLMGALVLAGLYRFSTPAPHGASILFWGSRMALAYLLVGLIEETNDRGYPLFALAQGIGFWPAAIGVNILFAAEHVLNSGEDPIGLCNVILAGLVFAYTLRWTGSLWWAIGCHMAWDWGESFFYGVADSGTVDPRHFLSGQPTGAAWLSGGSVGPEGSVLAIPALLLLIVMLRLTTRKQKVCGLERLRPIKAEMDGAVL